MKMRPPRSSQSDPLCLSSWECQCQSYGLIPGPLADSERSPASLCLSPVKQTDYWCPVFHFILILILSSHISFIKAFIYSFVSWRKSSSRKMGFQPLWGAGATGVRMALYWDVHGPCWVPLRWQCLRSSGADAGVQAPCAHFYPQGFALTSPCSWGPRGRVLGSASGLSQPTNNNNKWYWVCKCRYRKWKTMWWQRLFLFIYLFNGPSKNKKTGFLWIWWNINIK